MNRIIGLLFFTLAAITSGCVQDHCKAVNCNTGTCNAGICVCPAGYSGYNCEKNIYDEYIGDYAISAWFAGQSISKIARIDAGSTIGALKFSNFLWNSRVVEAQINGRSLTTSVMQQFAGTDTSVFIGGSIGKFGAITISGNFSADVYKNGSYVGSYNANFSKQ